jgi:hypothetical protein
MALRSFSFLFAFAFLLAPVANAEDAPKADKEGFYPIFDGKSLDGWKVGGDEKAFKVENGELLAGGTGASHLFYEGAVNKHDFKDFELKAQVMTNDKSNSGLYVHTKFQEKGWPTTGFECQVCNGCKDDRKTGSLYAVKDILKDSPAKDKEWFDYHIIVKGKTITTKINGKTVLEWTQPDNYKAAKDMPGRYIDHGTVAIQCHDPKSIVHYKNLRVKPLN